MKTTPTKSVFCLALAACITVSCDSPKDDLDSSADKSTPAAASETPVSQDAGLEKHIEATIESSPFELWATLHQKHPGHLEANPTLMERLVAQMIEQDSERALDTVVNMPKPNPKIAEQAARAFCSTHSHERLWSWHSGMKDTLSPDIYDAVALAGGKHCMEIKEFYATYGWIKLMRPSDVRLKLRYANYEAHSVHQRSEAGKDPEAFITTIIAANDEHENYWLSLGIEIWTNESPDRPQQWYDSNKEKLSIPQRDYLNLGFARIALKSGDFEGSKKLGRRITDPALKEKLKAETPSVQSPFTKPNE